MCILSVLYMSGLVRSLVKNPVTRPIVISCAISVVCIIILLASFVGLISLGSNTQLLFAIAAAASAAYGYWSYIGIMSTLRNLAIGGSAGAYGGCNTCGGCPTCVSGGCMTCGGVTGGIGFKDLQKIPELVTSARQLSQDVKAMCAAANGNPVLVEKCASVQTHLAKVDAVLALLQ